MNVTTVLSAWDQFDRLTGHGRSIMIQHSKAYAALVEAMRALRLEHLEEAQHPRKLDGESSPEYVTKGAEA